MTTATFPRSGARIARGADRFAPKGWLRTLFERFVAGRQFEADLLVARMRTDLRTERWCDTTERRLIDGFSRRPEGL